MSTSTVTETPTVISTKPTLVISSPDLLTSLSPKAEVAPTEKSEPAVEVTADAPESVKKAKSAGEVSSDDEGETAQNKEQRRSSGVCKWYSTVKGYGFICPEDDGEDVFVHQTAINVSGYRSLQDGEAVEFEFYIDENGRRRARNVTGPKGSPVVGQPAGRAAWQRASSMTAIGGGSAGASLQGSITVPMGYPMQMVAAAPMNAYPTYAGGAVGQPMMVPADPMAAMRVSMNARQSAHRNQQRASAPADLSQSMPYMTVDMYGNTYYVDSAGMQRMSMQPAMEYQQAQPMVMTMQPQQHQQQEQHHEMRRNSQLGGARTTMDKRRASMTKRSSLTRNSNSSGSTDSYKRNSIRRQSSGNENAQRFANRIRPSLVARH